MSTTLTRRGTAAALIAGLAVALAACGSSGGAATGSASAGASTATSAAVPTAAPSSQATVTPEPTPALTAEPTAVPEITPPPQSTAAPTLDPFADLSQDKDLEARLPDSFGGAKLQKFSVSGADMPEDPQGTAYLKAIGKTAADLSMAGATGAGGDPVFIAIRVKGATADQLKTMFQLSAQREAAKGSSVKLEVTSLDGVEVFRSTDSETKTVAYFVVRGDTALGASGSSDAVARKAFAALAK